MRKICVVITARPSYSRIKSVLSAIKNCKDMELQLVVMASALIDRYGSAVETIEKDGFLIDAKLFTVFEGESLSAAAKTTGIGVLELSTVFAKLNPDFVITIADRFETMATAVSAAYMNIPLIHIQGGEITGNIDEKVRHSITKLADYHFVATEIARKRVVLLGEDPSTVFNTGCPSLDLISEDLELDFNPFEKYGGVGDKFCLESGYFVVMQHPVTNEYGQAHNQIQTTIQAISTLGLPTFWFWPNVDAGSDEVSKGIRVARENGQLPKVHFFKNMEPLDFLKLLNSSLCLIGNSSVGIRECSYIGLPVVNIGSRQNKRERGNNVLDVSYDAMEIVNAINFHIERKERHKSFIYGDGRAGSKIAELLLTIPPRFHKTLTFE
jgi:UDP-hydrolysing UDP-N-acetyl-D-glucosamine 2-epimerase